MILCDAPDRKAKLTVEYMGSGRYVAFYAPNYDYESLKAWGKSPEQARAGYWESWGEKYATR